MTMTMIIVIMPIACQEGDPQGDGVGRIDTPTAALHVEDPIRLINHNGLTITWQRQLN
jgi:hypothetical protein